MAAKDIRWIQRFQSFEAAFFRLKEAMDKPVLNELECDGLIRYFKFTVELSWKLFKEYLEKTGVDFKPLPRETIRQAYKSELITSIEPWIDALELRNNLLCDYTGELFKKSQNTIRQNIYPDIEHTYLHFKTLRDKEQKKLFNE